MPHYIPKDQTPKSFTPDEKSAPKEKKPPYKLKRSAIKRTYKKSDHKSVYLNFFGFKDESEVFCEIPHCGKLAVDVNHIDCRGMGGTTHVYTAEELMGMCRKHHDEYGDKKQWKEFLRVTHERFISNFKPTT